MKFFVTTVLEQQDDYEVTGDVFYINERSVKIAGVQHNLHYGDIVKHGDFDYYINEDSVSNKEHENSFHDFWNLKNGLMPDDGNRYFIIVDEATNFSTEMEIYLEMEGKIVSRDDVGLSLYQHDTKIFNQTTNKPFLSDDLVDISDLSRNEFNENARELAESRKREITEDQEFVGLLSEKAAELIYTPKDGNDGNPGTQGNPGTAGKNGRRGLQGRPGETKVGPKGDPGKMGPRAKPGIAGAPGKPGPKGDRGPPGPNVLGKPGKDGKPGLPGKDGNPGEKGEPGLVLTEEKSTEYVTNLKKEFDSFKELDKKYKWRLNHQLGTLGGGGSSQLMDNDDVEYVAPSALANGQFLAYNTTTSKFALTTKDGLFGGANSDTIFPIYIQNTAPVTSAAKYMWIETAISGDANCFSFWFQDGIS